MLAAEAERELGEITGTEDEQQAAVKLQAMQRGRKARARVAELKAQKLAAEAAAASAEARTEEAEVRAATAGAAEEEPSFEVAEEDQRGWPSSRRYSVDARRAPNFEPNGRGGR